ncbi:MAG: site-specific DNA-methyltransferase [Ignavibacteria bacterium]|nr:site-specific DNA-methyltransferase [Ignavibacteria bacterium]
MPKSPLNKTIKLTRAEMSQYSSGLITLNAPVSAKKLVNKTIHQDLFAALEFLPDKFVDLLIIDPPYNLNKHFNSLAFQKKSINDYASYLDEFISKLEHTLKPDASIYVCGDWHSSISIPLVLEKHFIIRNRITWEREKGRGSKANWKNSSEDIWFCTMSNKFTFNTEKVKMLRKVLAPYREENGNPKDWKEYGKNGYRLTFPSNIWTDISVPFWSMPENTDHPTQKPEKLIAKLILASSNKDDFVFDPFLGSGTTSVVAKKLSRKYLGVEIDKTFACLAEKRLQLAESNRSIQGYEFDTFWERNTKPFLLKQSLD